MQKKKSPIKLLLKWAGREKYWIYLSILLSFISGICTMIPYYGIYRLMDAVYNNGSNLDKIEIRYHEAGPVLLCSGPALFMWFRLQNFFKDKS